jgi:hypothetical protein
MTTVQAGVQADAAPARIETSGDSSAAVGGRSAGSAGATSGAEGSPVKAPAAGRGGAAASGAGSSGNAGVAGMPGASAGEGGQPAKNARGFVCPAGPFPAPVPANATATRIDGVPLLDAFNDNGNTRTNIEGPVWIDGTLYVSEFQFQPAPTSRILALELATGKVSVAATDVGTNGLAVDMSGAFSIGHGRGAHERLPGQALRFAERSGRALGWHDLLLGS